MYHKWFAVNRDQRLRDGSGQRSQTSCQTAGKYSYRQHGVLYECARTEVPPKSNCMRTSRSPAPRMAERKRVLSSVYSSRNPPPPAPISLPPRVPWKRAKSYISSIKLLLIPGERFFLCSQ